MMQKPPEPPNIPKMPVGPFSYRGRHRRERSPWLAGAGALALIGAVALGVVGSVKAGTDRPEISAYQVYSDASADGCRIAKFIDTRTTEERRGSDGTIMTVGEVRVAPVFSLTVDTARMFRKSGGEPPAITAWQALPTGSHSDTVPAHYDDEGWIILEPSVGAREGAELHMQVGDVPCMDYLVRRGDAWRFGGDVHQSSHSLRRATQP